jgi:hypothetical protein
MPRRRHNFGSGDALHKGLAEGHYAEARRLFDGLPPSCYGGIKISNGIIHEIASAKAHVWSMDSDARHGISDLIGKLNVMEKDTYANIDKIAAKCGHNGRWR